MRLFLDSTTRVFRGVAPDGTSNLGTQLTVGTIEVDVSDANWTATYYPAWSASAASGQDLVIDIFGGTSLVTHTATAREQAISTLYAYQGLASPTQPQDSAAIKALIVLLEITNLLSSLPVPVVGLQRAPIAQTRKRPTRPRSRSFVVSAGSPAKRPLVSQGKLRRPTTRNQPPRMSR